MVVGICSNCGRSCSNGSSSGDGSTSGNNLRFKI